MADSELRKRRAVVGSLVAVARLALLDQGQLSRAERGLSGMRWKTAERLGAVLDVSTEEVLRLVQAARRERRAA